MGGEVVGQVIYDARIDTSKLPADGKRADSIVAGTGDRIEKTGARSFGAFGTYAKAGVLVAAAAIATLGVKVAQTGAEYNTLQQTTRAALKTLLGGAEAANEQMDKLDAFARKSPFAKDVFIKAQQQLIGFGVDARKVVPTLGAIEDAVAAAGGKSSDIAAITDVLARIRSQGKLSGEALERLGYYGIDAAAIIGKQMGKTGAEIREMASKPGGIPADQVWNPLVDGLEQKYGGAADNVKNTFAGTVDRIKASFRDLSAALIAPFIDPNGGGYAVTWGNRLADSFRSLEAFVKATQISVSESVAQVQSSLRPLVEWFRVNLLPVLTEIGGFIRDNFKQAWDDLSVSVGILRDQLRPIEPFLRAIGVAVAIAVIAPLVIAAGVVLAIAVAFSKFVEMVAYATRKLSEFWKAASEAGGNIIGGLVSGISNGAGAVVNKIKEICNSALSAVKKFFGIKSPSRVMAEMGNYLMSGFGQGIDRGASTAVSSAVKASEDVMSAFGGGVASPSLSADFGSHKGSGAAGGVNQTNHIYNQVDLDVASRQLAYQVGRG